MKVAFISDVHGNSPALGAVLNDIAGYEVDELINLGDLFNGLDPHGCCQLLRQWCEEQTVDLTCIRGNAEEYLLTPDLGELHSYGLDPKQWLIDLVKWWKARLSPEDLEWLAAFPRTLRWQDALLVHDSPFDRVNVVIQATPNLRPEHREWFFHGMGITHDSPEEEWRLLFATMEEHHYNYIFCGHSHIPFIHEQNGKIICNAGSAGTPLDGDWRPSWVLLETHADGKGVLTIQRVEYDLTHIHRLCNANPNYPQFLEDPGILEAYKRQYTSGVHWREHLHAKQEGCK
ncbi:MAG: metallophosphoesterase family protein [Anaerolineae bacterium]|jgi:predicted phosphodiesterase|nr:metallophosphoesterase family protein [Anaerolineae bacterium]